MSTPERLQKFLSRCGVASRRAAEELIRNGEVAVNGEIVTIMGVKVDPEVDVVTVNGEPVQPPATQVYYAYYKPRGLVVSRNDELGRKTIFDQIPETDHRLIAVGRLDRESEGLLLLTDDGAWAQSVAHPSNEVEKEYEVLVSGTISQALLRQMRNGVKDSEGEILSVDRAGKIDARNHQTMLRLILHEGRKRHIRRLLEALDIKIFSLKRVRIGEIVIDKLKPGRMRKLTAKELKSLKK